MPGSRSVVHPILPLAVLESVRGLDLPNPDAFPEFHDDLSSKRLGLSRTVAAQIDRFARLVRSGGAVEADEFVALLRLVGRRNDAGLVFSDAGRRAGRLAVQRSGTPLSSALRALPGGLGAAAGFRVARRAARMAFGATLRRTQGVAETVIENAPSAQVTEGGGACSFYGAGLAEVLHVLTGFEGALFHVACRARGDTECVWRTSTGTTTGETA